MLLRWGCLLLSVNAAVLCGSDAVKGFGQLDFIKLRNDHGVSHLVPSRSAIAAKRVVFVDKSFYGFVPGAGQLPDSAQLFESYPLFPEDFKKSLTPAEVGVFQFDAEDVQSTHGLEEARLHWAITGQLPEGPEYALVVARNVVELMRAAKFATWWGADLVIQAQNFPDFGNRDATGPWYDAIKEYLQNGEHFWLNSNGNYGHLSHTTQVRLDNENRVIFANGSRYLRLKMRLDGVVQIIAAWDSFSSHGSDKDLDLYVLNEDGRTVYEYEKLVQSAGQTVPEITTGVAASEIKQRFREEGDKDFPPLTRETLLLPLKKNSADGYYYIEIKAPKANLGLADELRVIVSLSGMETGTVNDETRKLIVPSVELIDWTPDNNVYFPALYKEVVTVGELSVNSSRGPTANGVLPLEVFLPQVDVMYSNGRRQSGTSPATSILGGIITLLTCEYPGVTRAEFGRYLRTLELPPLSLESDKVTNLFSDVANWNNQQLPLLKSRYPGIFSILRKHSERDIIAVGRLENRGQYVVGYDVSPGQFRRLFATVPANGGNQYEYYIAFWKENNRSYYKGFTRKKETNSEGEEEGYPWLREGVLARDPSQYIELRYMRSNTEIELEKTELAKRVGKVWRMPTDEEGQRFFGN